MKVFSSLSVAIVSALAITPALMFGQCSAISVPGGDACYNFNVGTYITDGTILISSTTPSTVDVAYGGYDILSVTGIFSNPGGPSGELSLYPGNSAYPGVYSSDSLWQYDNEFYPSANAPGTTGGVVDYGGLLMYIGDPTVANPYVVNLWAYSPTQYGLQWGQIGITNDLGGNGTLGGTISGYVPPSPQSGGGDVLITSESNSLWMLLLAVFALAGAFVFKGKQSGSFLAA